MIWLFRRSCCSQEAGSGTAWRCVFRGDQCTATVRVQRSAGQCDVPYRINAQPGVTVPRQSYDGAATAEACKKRPMLRQKLAQNAGDDLGRIAREIGCLRDTREGCAHLFLSVGVIASPCIKRCRHARGCLRVERIKRDQPVSK